MSNLRWEYGEMPQREWVVLQAELSLELTGTHIGERQNDLICVPGGRLLCSVNRVTRWTRLEPVLAAIQEGGRDDAKTREIILRLPLNEYDHIAERARRWGMSVQDWITMRL